MNLKFKILAEDGKARTGVLSVNGKRLETPNVIYAATYATINCITPSQYPALGVNALMLNTFHLARPNKPNGKLPIIDLIEKKGGVSNYMGLKNEVTMSDSGGFQIMSYGDSRVDGTGKVAFPYPNLVKDESKRKVYVDEKGATFHVVIDGAVSEFRLTPEISMQLQARLNTDIAFAFDQCHTLKDHEETRKILNRSHRWEKESLERRNKNQALYGIVHGGQFKDLRLKSASVISEMGFDGLSIGGYLGSTAKEMHEVLDYTIPAIDRSKPLHLLGIGRINDFFECISRGVDTFDCVEITRLGRHNWAIVHPSESDKTRNVLVIKESQHKNDDNPISRYCGCHVCKTMTRADLISLKAHNADEEIKKKNENLYRSALTSHNIAFVSKLMSDIRTAIKEHRFESLKKEWLGVIGSKRETKGL